MNQRRSLTDILNNGNREKLERSWEETEAASELNPLPRGEYIAHIIAGELIQAKTGTPGYQITFQVIEGEYLDRRFWHTIWLTDAAMKIAKRDLQKLGVRKLEQLEHPLPQGIRVKATLMKHMDDQGFERNHVHSFEVLGIDAPEQDPYAPDDDASDSNTDAQGKGGDDDTPV